MHVRDASDLFKKAISQRNRELRIRATIDGVEYSGSDVQSCTIEESILTGEEFKFGGATASSIDLTLLNMDESLSARSFDGKTVSIEIGVQLDKFSRPFEYVPMGSFFIEKASKEKSLIKMSGFDKMILFEQPYVTELEYPATLKEVLHEICSFAGVPLKTTSFINDDYIVANEPDLDEVTLRTALEHVSELACGWARINRDDELEIATLTNTDVAIDRSNYYSMNLSEYEYGPINYVVINNEGIIEDIGEGNNILEIKDNIFTFNEKGQLLPNIFAHVEGSRFKPFKSTWQGNPLTGPSDVIEVSYNDGETYKSFIAKQKFTFSNGLKCDVETNAKTKMQIDYETKGPVTKSLGRVKGEIKNLGNEILLRVTKEEYETYISILESSIIAKAEDEDGNVIMSLKPDSVQIGFNDINDKVYISSATFEIRDKNGNVTIKDGVVYARELVASDGSKKVSIGGDGRIFFDGIILAFNSAGVPTMGMFPEVGLLRAEGIQPFDDGQKMTMGRVKDVRADYVQAEKYDESVAMLCVGHLVVTGNKNNVQRTKNHGDVLLHAYETPTPFYGDIGEGVISDGECIVYLDEILQECINTDLMYQVFTQVYNGALTSIRRFKEYFVVHGEEGTQFGWEVKGKRKGYEYERFTRFTELRKEGTPEDTPMPDTNLDNYEVIE